VLITAVIVVCGGHPELKKNQACGQERHQKIKSLLSLGLDWDSVIAAIYSEASGRKRLNLGGQPRQGWA
jgi:hypothetical protein